MARRKSKQTKRTRPVSLIAHRIKKRKAIMRAWMRALEIAVRETNLQIAFEDGGGPVS